MADDRCLPVARWAQFGHQLSLPGSLQSLVTDHPRTADFRQGIRIPLSRDTAGSRPCSLNASQHLVPLAIAGRCHRLPSSTRPEGQIARPCSLRRDAALCNGALRRLA